MKRMEVTDALVTRVLTVLEEVMTNKGVWDINSLDITVLDGPDSDRILYLGESVMIAKYGNYMIDFQFRTNLKYWIVWRTMLGITYFDPIWTPQSLMLDPTLNFEINRKYAPIVFEMPFEMIPEVSVEKGNIIRRTDFSQVCVWPGTKLDDTGPAGFEAYMFKEFGVRVQYLENITTSSGGIPGEGGRSDLFFAVHKDDISRFAVPRLEADIRWIEDVLATGNYIISIYPKRVFGYKTW